MIDWFDLLVVQGTLKSFLQHHRNLKASILWCSAFFMVQLSHQHMTTGKTIALTRETFVSKVKSLLFNMLSRMVIAFFLKEQASFNFMTEVTICSDFGAQEDKVCHCFHFFPHLFAVMRCVHMSQTPWGTCSPWDFRLVGSPVTSAF